MAHRQPIRHGTYSGYQTHHKRGEPMCDACAKAARQYRRKFAKPIEHGTTRGMKRCAERDEGICPACKAVGERAAEGVDKSAAMRAPFAPMPWSIDAACRGLDPELFHPASNDIRDAEQVCRRCDVRGECLDYALTNRIDGGIWGGTTGRQRVKMRSERNRRKLKGQQ